jgi:hypothetical protein
LEKETTTTTVDNATESATLEMEIETEQHESMNTTTPLHIALEAAQGSSQGAATSLDHGHGHTEDISVRTLYYLVCFFVFCLTNSQRSIVSLIIKYRAMLLGLYISKLESIRFIIYSLITFCKIKQLIF